MEFPQGAWHYQQARHGIASGGDDGANAEVAVNARALSAERTGHPLTCLVHIVDPQLCSLLREHEQGGR